MATILSVVNQKGGCGKTTTAMNLAGGLHKIGYRVLVVDADGQASSAMWSLAKGQGSLPFDVVTARQIKNKLAALADNDEYDIAIIDCAPGVAEPDNDAGKLARTAVREADALLIPLRPSTLDFSAAATFVRYLESQERGREQKTLVLINGKRNTLLDRQASAQAAVLFGSIAGAKVLASSIGFRAPITEVSGSGKTIFDYAPRSEAAREYLNLTKEVISWLSMTAQDSQPSISPASMSLSPSASAANL